MKFSISILVAILSLFFSINSYSNNLEQTNIFNAEAEASTLPNSVQVELKRFHPESAKMCGFSGKEFPLSDKPNGTVYYAVRPIDGKCFGSSGTTLWIVSLKNGNAKVILSDVGMSIVRLQKNSHGLHDIKFTGGNARSNNVNLWSYNGTMYVKVYSKVFSQKDCQDPVKSKDTDFPWDCIK